MYHYTLNFILIGMPERAVSILREMEPLERFSHLITPYPSMEDVPEDGEVPMHTVVILSDDVHWSAPDLESRFRGKARLILSAGNPGKLDDEVLSRFYEIWPALSADSVARYEFSGLLKRIKEEKDAWFTSQYLDAAIDSSPDMVWFKDMPGCHLKLNKAFCEAVGKKREDVTGKYHGYIWGLSGDDADKGEEICRRSEMEVAKARKTCYFAEEVRHSTRGMCLLKVMKTPIYDESGKVVGTVGMARDITKEKEDQEKILQLAHTDALTGLANRRYFYEYVEENRKKYENLSICYIDLDYFKQLNDAWGHQSGDAALLGVAELLRNTFPKDFITRLGGDEFVVAVFGVTSRDKMMEKVEHLKKTANEFFQMDECLMGLSMSMGIALTGTPDLSLDTLLQRSDDALYYVKEHGRGTHCFYEDVVSEIEAIRKF